MQLVERFKKIVLEEIWDFQPSQLTRHRVRVYKQLRFFWIVVTGFAESQVRLQALALSFKLMISLAPLLAVAFSVLKAFGVQNRLRPALGEALAPLGPKGDEITARLFEFVDNMNVGALGSIGLVTLFFTVVSLLGNIESAFNQIWRVKTARPLTRKFSDYLSTLTIGPVLIFSALGVTASLQSSSLVKQLMALEPFGSLILLLLRLVPYLTVWAAFTFLYVFVPNTRVRLKSALVGALVGAVLWQTAGWAFAAFVATSTKYYAIYSGFAILLLFLLWIYYGWMILLFGAQVAFVHQNLGIFEMERRSHGFGGLARERLALLIMGHIGQSFYSRNPGWTVTMLGKQLQVAESLVQEVITALKRAKLVLESTEGRVFFPARDPEQIEIKEILDAVRIGEEPERRYLAQGDRNAVDDLLHALNESVAVALRGKNLKDLVLAMRHKAKG